MVDGKRKRSDDAPKAKDSDHDTINTTKSTMKMEESSFPRGGGSVLSALEIKEASNEAVRDSLFAVSTPVAAVSDAEAAKNAKRARARKGSKVTKTQKPKEEKTKIEGLSFSRLIPGTLVLGQVHQINTLDITLSLPNNLVGFVPVTNISTKISESLENDSDSEDEDEEKESPMPELRSLFKIGQWLRAIVVESGELETQGKEKKTKKRIELSIEPEKVNNKIDAEDLSAGAVVQASVTSVEDHGCIMEISPASSVSGFISRKELENSGFTIDNMKVGQVLLLSVLSKSSNGRTLTLTSSHTAKRIPFISSVNSVDSLVPGVMVEPIITEIRSNGLVLKVLGLIDGTIDLFQTGLQDSSSLKDKFKEGEKIKARVLATLPSTEDNKKVVLSVVPHVVSLSTANDENSTPLEAFPVGHIFEEAKIKFLEPVAGLFVDIGAKTLGFVHISRISDDRVENLSAESGPYKPGTVHRARVLGFSAVDNLYILSMEPKVLAQKFLRVVDVPVGEVISGEVSKILPKGGLIIDISSNMSGIVNENNMSDIKLIYPEKKFSIGMKIKARVLSIDTQHHKIKLTVKKTLVNTQDPIITSFESVKPGMKTSGTIIAFKPKGAIVEFFGGVRGFLPVSEISEAFIKDPKEHFRLGQTVTVRVVSVEAESRKLIVSCRTSDVINNAQAAQLEELIPGKSIVSGTIIEKSKNDVVVEIGAGHVRGVIVLGQLSDETGDRARAIQKKMKVGQVIEELVVLEKNIPKRFVTLSAKKALVEDAKKSLLPATFDDIKVGEQVIHGYVRSATPKGVFVGFAGNLTGLALKQHISDDQFVSDPSSMFDVYQTVACTIIKADAAQNRIQVSFRKNINKDSSPASKPASVTKPAVNPVDESIESLNEFKPGKVTKARIISIKDTQLNVQLADNQQGRIDVSQVFDNFTDIQDKLHPLDSFKRGQVIPVKIIGYHDAKNHRYLAITHRSSNTHIILELSAKPTDVAAQDEHSLLSLNDTKPGTEWVGFVNNIAGDHLWVNLSPTVRGRISFFDLTNNPDYIQSIEVNFPIGSAIRCIVQEIDSEHNNLRLRAAELDQGEGITSFEDVKEGSIVAGKILKISDLTILAQLAPNITATVFITDALDDYSSKLSDFYATGEFVKAKILTVDSSNKKIYASLRASITEDDKEEVTDKNISEPTDLKKGDTVRGFIKNVADQGVFVALGRSVTARVKISNLSDSFLTEWKKYFQVHQLVKGKVVSVDQKTGKIDLTLKDSSVSGTATNVLQFSDLNVGDIVDGMVKRVEEYGVFIKIDHTANVSGLCHRSEIAESPITDARAIFNEGDKVKAKILKIDEEKKKISLGLKASYFDDDEDSKMEDDSDADDSDVDMIADESDDEENDFMVDDSDDSDINEDSDSGSDSEASDSESKPASTGLSAGFDFTASVLDQVNDNGSDSESDEETEERSRKRRRKNKVVEDKTADLSTRVPQSNQDYERLLISSPNSSILWMNYMAFQLQLGEVEKSREIAARALKTIAFKEEQEKLNIWIASLNLENSFGSSETLEETFKKACQYNDAKTIHLKLINIYTQSEDKLSKAEELYQITAKKFGYNDIAFWVNYATFLIEKTDNITKARTLLDRALQVLPKRLHAETISKFSLLEFKKGDVERGRTLFEGLISSYPRRIDLWNVYLDQEIKQGEKPIVERLFERVIAIKLSLKQAKFFFKKWLSFEDKCGDDKAVDYVKAKAAEYVASRTKAAESGDEESGSEEESENEK
ncbi:nucleic acid-binding protein [Nadsonia fulvescens var. elongata DSM 6958]|uniref:mRNA 3'-end-processing protein RNA14 n=1 Tax=Nadsonia fulvescens var. elongata DSM 6958 TaxID=857566 RepID=A0A1E3PIA8_9ASCO|nr:nucleic acid-binding protein [Nadsonia fulvescens var. elongata DSM 6958]